MRADPGSHDAVEEVVPVISDRGRIGPSRLRRIARLSGGELLNREASIHALDENGTPTRVEGGVGRPPMPRAASRRLFAIAESLMPDLEGVAVGGGSDGNFTAALGIPTLDGLGSVGGGAHTDHEHIVVERMAERADLIAGLVGAIQQGALDNTTTART